MREPTTVEPRCSLGGLNAVAKTCRTRGGTCDCRGPCMAITLATERLNSLERERREVELEIAKTEDVLRRVQTSPARLRDGFKFKEGLTPVIVFDGGEASFGYEDANGDWECSGEWPFAEAFVWPDDCERLGIRVE